MFCDLYFNTGFAINHFFIQLYKLIIQSTGFKINTIQVDNGYEFVNDAEKTNRKTRFQLVAEYLGMKIKRTRPYSPWQNGKVERSHREDGKILYGRKIFRSEKELKTAVKNICKDIIAQLRSVLILKVLMK